MEKPPNMGAFLCPARVEFFVNFSKKVFTNQNFSFVKSKLKIIYVFTRKTQFEAENFTTHT